MKVNDMTEELEAFLSKNSAVESVDAMFPDMCGIIRGKQIAVAAIDLRFRSGEETLQYTPADCRAAGKVAADR